jgi:hypothetical protein
MGTAPAATISPPGAVGFPLSIVIAMVGTGASSEMIAFVAVIVPWSAAFVAIVVMIVPGSNPYATGTNINFHRKCSCRKDDGGGGDCSKNICSHGLLLLRAHPLSLLRRQR